MSNTPMRYTFLDLVTIPFRMLVLVPFLPFTLLAGLLKVFGIWGEWLGDACDDISRSVAMHLNPHAWALFKQYKEERDAFERGESFWKAEAKRLGKELDKANGVESAEKSL